MNNTETVNLNYIDNNTETIDLNNSLSMSMKSGIDKQLSTGKDTVEAPITLKKLIHNLIKTSNSIKIKKK